MFSNYDGSSVGQKNAQFGALDEIYRRWDAAAEKADAHKVEDNRPAPNGSTRLSKIAAAFLALALIATVVMLATLAMLG